MAKEKAKEIDRRTVRTRKALHGALIVLILRKGYEAVTVQDIIDEADVGRSTFYAHYTGKEALLRSGFDMLRADLEQAGHAQAGHVASADGAGSPDGRLHFSLALFKHAAEYKHVFRALVGGRGGIVAITEIRRALTDLVRKELPAARSGDAIPQDVRVQFVVGAFLTVLTWWLDRKSSLTPAEVNGIFRALAIDGIGSSNAKHHR